MFKSTTFFLANSVATEVGMGLSASDVLSTFPNPISPLSITKVTSTVAPLVKVNVIFLLGLSYDALDTLILSPAPLRSTVSVDPFPSVNDKLFVIGDIKLVQRLNKWKEDEVAGFEVFIDNFDKLKLKAREVYENIDPKLNSTSIADKDHGLFEWLDMFDINIRLIIIIMIIISGINMITALLVLILERTQMIGILKSLGNSNKSIQKIFLYNAAYLIIKGLFWGNLIGIGLLLVQKYFGIVTLDPENYYVNKAPVYIDISYILTLNISTLFLCLIMLIIPTFMVSKINPVKAIKFS